MTWKYIRYMNKPRTETHNRAIQTLLLYTRIDSTMKPICLKQYCLLDVTVPTRLKFINFS